MGDFKWPKMYAVGVFDGSRGGGADKVFEQMLVDHFPNSMKTINPQIQEANKT